MGKENVYTFEEIIKDNNLIFNLRLDTIFKKVFLNPDGRTYINELLSKSFEEEYDSNNDFILVNSELSNKNIYKKTSCADLVVRNKNIDFIIEMNHCGKNYILEKNTSYTFNIHLSKSNNSNRYGKDMYTYLLNIDDYDILGENSFVYESSLNYIKYNKCLYKNIKIKHINLDYLKDKYYNKGVRNFTEFEKLLLIFIEQRKDKIREIVKNDAVEGVIKIMDRMKIDMTLPTYDGEEYDRLERISFENNKREFSKVQEEFNREQDELKKKKEKLNEDKEKLNEDKEKLNEDKEKFDNQKKSIVQEFKKLGLSLKKISELTKLSIDQIKMLL